MEIIPLEIPDVLLIKPKVFNEERGFFVETMRSSLLNKANIPKLIQHNQSRSKKGVVRGLHYQLNNPQGKLVRCSYGKIFDVAVDLRTSSLKFGNVVTAILDDVEHNQLWIPPGFAHGFMVLSEQADCCYFCSDYYHPQSEQGIAWDDPDLDIPWPELSSEIDIILSSKDKNNPQFKKKNVSEFFD